MVRHLKKIAAGIFRCAVNGIKVLFQMPQGCCRFYPSCTDYAADAIETQPVAKAVPRIIKRVLKCHPFSRGGFDPVLEPPSAGKVELRE